MLTTEFKTNLQSQKDVIDTSSKRLSRAQYGVWIAQKMDPASPRYNCGGYLEIYGTLELAFFRQAVNIAVNETEALHVRFFEENGEIWQANDSSLEWSLHFVDASQTAHPQQTAEVWMKTDLTRAVDLHSSKSLFNHAIFKIASNKFFFYFRYHHILMDGFSQTLYWQRLSEIYSALIKNQKYAESCFSSLSSILEEESAYFSSPQFERDRKFWLEEFIDLPNPIRLTNRSSHTSRNMLRRIMNLSDLETQNLKQAAHHAKTRWSVILIAATAAYIHRLTGMEDLVFGLPVSSRLTPVSRTTPCMMANELPLRLHINHTNTCRELIEQVSKKIGRVLKHQRYRSEDLYREIQLLGSERQLIGPVINVASLERDIHFAGYKTIAHHLSSGPIKDILIGFYSKSDGSKMQIYFDANPDIYSADDVAILQKRFHIFLNEFVTIDSNININKINIFLDGEIQKIVCGFNKTSRPYSLTKCLHVLIDEQAQLTPNLPAVITSRESITYKKLIEYSNRLAFHIRGKGVTPGQRVGVYDIRSIEMVISLLAVLKAGAAYVPLDPELPKSRIEYQIRDADIDLVLSRSTLTKSLMDLNLDLIPVDKIISQLVSIDKSEQFSQLATPESAAYVIYTSGSTGTPKGVILSHKGIVNRLLWMQETYDLNSRDCVLQKTPFTFDVSVWEIFWPLLAGSKLFLAEPKMHRDPRYIVKTIREQNISIVHFVPPMLDLFLAESKSSIATRLRTVICSGEALKPKTVDKFFEVFKPDKHNVELHNLYGPTEASIDVTSWQCTTADAKSIVPIGKPIANTQIYLLDSSGEPTPIGTPGEIYIGGVQVALGYLNLSKVNREKFVPNPFSKNETLYRTGDLAVYRQDGVIEFLGRLDNQVKIRGFRIELGEIESALKTHPMVAQAVVNIWERQVDDRRLLAYVVLNCSSTFDVKELEKFLTKKLPEYMIPSHIILLDQLPLLSNGKINRRALSKPSKLKLPTERAKMPNTSEEHLLYKVWCEILGLEHFSIDDSFFALGGDSMLSIRLRTAVERYNYTFEIQDLFRFPTISKLAKKLRAIVSNQKSRLCIKSFEMIDENERVRLPGNVVDAYPISTMQAGMLFHTELDSESSIYRVVTSLHVIAKFDRDILCKAIGETFQRHPLLRTSFNLSNYSEPLQLVHSDVEVLVEIVEDISSLDLSSQEEIIHKWIGLAKLHRFDISKPPLVLFKIHLRGKNSFQLSVIEHHAVIDGWSDISMLDEIITRYNSLLNGEEMWLSEVPSVYRNFVAAERQILASEASRRFWREHLKGAESIQLPRKSLYFENTKQKFNHKAFDVSITKEITEKLRLIAQQENLPLKSLLMTAHIAVLYQIFRKSEVLTGIVFNGRLEEEGGDEVIGVFLNTLPLRINVQSKTFISIAHEIFQQEQEFLPHGRYPFAQMQQDVNGQIFLDSYINFMDFHRQWKANKPKNTLIKKAIGVAETNFSLAVNFLVDPFENHLTLWLDCNTALLDVNFCKQLVNYYQQALNLISDSPGNLLNHADLKDQSELDQIVDWNNTLVPYNQNITIHSLIEDQIKLSADKIALAYRWKTITYKELDERANQLAHYLKTKGVQKGQLIGVSLNRSIELLVALIAILKAGGAYVPLDPDFPKERLEFIVMDSSLDYLITDSACLIETKVKHIILIDAHKKRIEIQPKSPIQLEISGDDLAYVIYTSGSTGTPKGTAVKHSNVVNFFIGMNVKIGCNSEDTVLAITSVSFDISVLELIWPLTHGAKVVIAGEKLIRNLIPDEQIPNFAIGFDIVIHKSSFDNLQSQSIEPVINFAALHNFGNVQFLDESGIYSINVKNSSPSKKENSLVWVTPTASIEEFEQAGASGKNLLTSFANQSLEIVEIKIKAYQKSRHSHGFTSPGKVSILLPTLILENTQKAHQLACETLQRNRSSFIKLWQSRFTDTSKNIEASENESFDEIIENFLHYTGLFGSPNEVLHKLRQLAAIGVDKAACLLDFEVSYEVAFSSLSTLKKLKMLHQQEVEEAQHSFSTLCQRHNVTLIQGTPSFLSAIAVEPLAMDSLSTIRTVLVGGEAFSVGLANRLMSKLPRARIFNMYGPTETTIWSTVHELEFDDTKASIIPIGKPIANTRVQVLDEMLCITPIGVSGELWIGGDGVTSGYLGRSELTAERFLKPPIEKSLMYRTGDRVRWRFDGVLEFLGRIDRQVKILGQRVELDEVESVISRHPQVSSVAVVANSKASGDILGASTELIAYVSIENKLFNNEIQKDHVLQWSNVWETTYTNSDENSIEDSNKFAGWLSSYTSEPIPTEEMQEWLIHTLSKISELQPRSIVDVGVGVGLVLEAFSSKVERYIGIDVSKAALELVTHSLGGNLPNHVTLINSDASYLTKLRSKEIDTVILNSVVQYFPGIDYLKQVLNESIRVIDSKGKLFIGDIRNLDLLEAFHATVQLYRSPPLMSASQLADIIDKQVATERELCLSPAFFRQFSNQLNQNYHTHIELKRGRAINELTCFRYDVTLLSCQEKPLLRENYESLSWSELMKYSQPLTEMSNILENFSEHSTLVITKIPNSRLVRPLALAELINAHRTDDRMTVWELERHLWEVDDSKAIEPEEIVKIGQKLGFSVRLAIPEDDTPGEFDAIFESMNLRKENL
jgi:amino acid adenylation domain-containing protein